MNNRDYKIFRAGNYYHIYNRGNNKEPIFLDNQDYNNFLKRLRKTLGLPIPKGIFGTGNNKREIQIKSLQEGAFDIISYCLMKNHFHFLIKQNTEIGIDKLIAKLSTSYVKYINKKYSRVGNLFQDAFKAKLIDNDGYLKYLSAYIHNNPNNTETYPYSSFQEYLKKSESQICNTRIILGMFNNNPIEYTDFVLSFSTNDQMREIIQAYLFEEDDTKDSL